MVTFWLDVTDSAAETRTCSQSIQFIADHTPPDA